MANKKSDTNSASITTSDPGIVIDGEDFDILEYLADYQAEAGNVKDAGKALAWIKTPEKLPLEESRAVRVTRGEKTLALWLEPRYTLKVARI